LLGECRVTRFGRTHPLVAESVGYDQYAVTFQCLRRKALLVRRDVITIIRDQIDEWLIAPCGRVKIVVSFVE
jgi:hypothetical protein